MATNNSKQHKTYLPLDSKPGDCLHCPLRVDISWETMFCAGLQETIVGDDMLRRCPLRELPGIQTPPKGPAGAEEALADWHMSHIIGWDEGYCKGWNDCLGIISGEEGTDGQTEDL